jgi:hypothetical protein
MRTDSKIVFIVLCVVVFVFFVLSMIDHVGKEGIVDFLMRGF